MGPIANLTKSRPSSGKKGRTTIQYALDPNISAPKGCRQKPSGEGNCPADGSCSQVGPCSREAVAQGEPTGDEPVVSDAEQTEGYAENRVEEKASQARSGKVRHREVRLRAENLVGDSNASAAGAQRGDRHTHVELLCELLQYEDSATQGGREGGGVRLPLQGLLVFWAFWLWRSPKPPAARPGRLG